MTALVARLSAGRANDVVGAGRCYVSFGEASGAGGIFGLVLLLSMIRRCCCAANTDLFRESAIRYPDVDELPTCEPSRQTSSLVPCLFPSSALTAVHIRAIPVFSRSHHCYR